MHEVLREMLALIPPWSPLAPNGLRTPMDLELFPHRKLPPVRSNVKVSVDLDTFY